VNKTDMLIEFSVVGLAKHPLRYEFEHFLIDFFDFEN